MKPQRLYPGDSIATISPAWGCAGAPDITWRYELGVHRLEEIGLHVIAAPNALRSESFLEQNPRARADDFQWAFENKEVKAILANIGGNDSHRIIPYLSKDIIHQNPKILCGYSDVTTLHLYCHKYGLSTFYGPNLLTTIAENGGWHPFSKDWFIQTLFDPAPLGTITCSKNWSPDSNPLPNPNPLKHYIHNDGVVRVQGNGIIRGKLFGGNIQTLMLHENTDLLSLSDFEDCILFLEDVPNSWNVTYIQELFIWLSNQGYLERINGILIGKTCPNDQFMPFLHLIRSIVSEQYALPSLPILYGLNFGHSSPICTLPYDAQAEIDIDHLSFSISEGCVI